ncbi:hypothetical protein [Aliikangiella sp. IMCC44359]|uniref:hypothetical protein n=1 Tax=Aliikangiella sp. IMCC44359 TaxID=3459125 RepID=UPI00403A890C
MKTSIGKEGIKGFDNAAVVSKPLSGRILQDNRSLSFQTNTHNNKLSNTYSLLAKTQGEITQAVPLNGGTLQKVVIPAVTDDEENIDTNEINFKQFIQQLIEDGNSKRLMYIIKYILAHVSDEEGTLLLDIISQETGKVLPKTAVEDIDMRIEIFKQALSSKEFSVLVSLLQRNTQVRAEELLTLKDPGKVKELMSKWQQQELDFKSDPVRGDWGNSVQLAQPLIDLINSVLKHGILSPEEAQKRGLAPVSSVDKGVSDKISVNTFASKTRDLKRAREIAVESMSISQRGSASVSTERRDDSLLSKLPRWEDIELSLSEVEEINKSTESMLSMRKAVIDHTKRNKAIQIYKQALQGPLKGAINTRTRGTIMAILDQSTTGKSSTNVSIETGKPVEDSSQEVRKTTPQIRTGHIQTLLVPDFIRPYFDYIVNPADIPIRFVGSKEVSAYYKSPLGDIELDTVVAPDYVESIAQHLVEHEVISTHVMTTNARRYAVPPDFDEEAAQKELDEMSDFDDLDYLNDLI